MKMTEYPEVNSLLQDNILLVDGNTSGTKKIPVADAFLAMMHLVSPENHRKIFRGKNLGSVLTSSQLAAIKRGDFEDLWLGDYWTTSDGIKWRIVDFDYYYNTGDEGYKCIKHHLVIMPDTHVGTGKMCDSVGAASSGYIFSKLRENLPSTFEASSAPTIFGDTIFEHREWYPDNIHENGYPSDGTWEWSGKFSIPNEIMMYGCHIFAPMSDGSIDVFNYTVSKTQLALFRDCQKYIVNGEGGGIGYWLRDNANISRFTFVSENGEASYTSPTNTRGIRPYFLVG